MVQYSYGGYIRLSHNFQAETDDSVFLSYRDSKGNTGIIEGAFTDSELDTVDTLIGDGVLINQGNYDINLVIQGTRGGESFSVRSKSIQVKVYDGIYTED